MRRDGVALGPVLDRIARHRLRISQQRRPVELAVVGVEARPAVVADADLRPRHPVAARDERRRERARGRHHALLRLGLAAAALLGGAARGAEVLRWFVQEWGEGESSDTKAMAITSFVRGQSAGPSHQTQTHCVCHKHKAHTHTSCSCLSSRLSASSASPASMSWPASSKRPSLAAARAARNAALRLFGSSLSAACASSSALRQLPACVLLLVWAKDRQTGGQDREESE